MDKKKLTEYEKLYLIQVRYTNSNRHSSYQLMQLGMPYTLLTKLVKAGILQVEEDCNGIKYYGVSEDIVA